MLYSDDGSKTRLSITGRPQSAGPRPIPHSLSGCEDTTGKMKGLFLNQRLHWKRMDRCERLENVCCEHSSLWDETTSGGSMRRAKFFCSIWNFWFDGNFGEEIAKIFLLNPLREATSGTSVRTEGTYHTRRLITSGSGPSLQSWPLRIDFRCDFVEPSVLYNLQLQHTIQ